MEHLGYKKGEDGGFYEYGRILTYEAWREDSIIDSWEAAGWIHEVTKEFRLGGISQLHIYFLKAAPESDEKS